MKKLFFILLCLFSICMMSSCTSKKDQAKAIIEKNCPEYEWWLK